MRRMLVGSILGMLVVGSLPANAPGGWHEFHNRCKLDFYRNNAWPQPFIHMDRMSSCSPFVVMAQNGWSHQSTLSEYHFDPRTHLLTEAGQLKVRHILTQHPKGHRSIFVVKSSDDNYSSIRMDSVQQSVARWTESDGSTMPPVRFVTLDAPGRPASAVDAIIRKDFATIPAPRLPEFQSTTD